jgi:hypothetical protein
MMFLVGPAEPMQGPPHGGLAQLLALVLGPPGAVLEQRGLGGGFHARLQDHLLVAPDPAGTARDRLALQRARLPLLDHRPFDGGDRHSKAASGFSHGLTVGHRSHQAFFEAGRIRTHTDLRCISRACLWFAQNALVADELNIYRQGKLTLAENLSPVFLPRLGGIPKNEIVTAANPDFVNIGLSILGSTSGA